MLAFPITESDSVSYTRVRRDSDRRTHSDQWLLSNEKNLMNQAEEV